MNRAREPEFDEQSMKEKLYNEKEKSVTQKNSEKGDDIEDVEEGQEQVKETEKGSCFIPALNTLSCVCLTLYF